MLISMCLLFFLFTQVMTAYLLVKPFLEPKWYIDLDHQRINETDFFQYVQAGQLATSPLAHRVYDPEVQKTWHDELTAPLKAPKVFYNQQPPFLYPLLIPLAWFPYNVAYLLWCLGQSAAGLTAVYFLSGLNFKTRKEKVIFLMAVFASFPSYLCLWHGNTAFWLLGALGCYTYFWLRKKDIAAGAFFALSTGKPQYSMIMILPSLANWRWKIMATAAVIEMLLLVWAALFIGTENIVNYPQILSNAESNPNFIGVNSMGMVSLRGLYSRFLPAATVTHDSLIASTITMITCLAPIAWLWWRTSQPSTKNADHQQRCLLSITVLLALILSPHSQQFDCLLIAIPAALMLPSLDIFQICALKSAPLRIFSVTLLVYPFVSWMPNFTLGRQYESIPYLIVNLILLASLFCYFREGKRNGGDLGNEL